MVRVVRAGGLSGRKPNRVVKMVCVMVVTSYGLLVEGHRGAAENSLLALLGSDRSLSIAGLSE